MVDGAPGVRRVECITTDRLQLRPYDAGDIDGLHALWTDPDVRRYLWDDTIIGREVVEAEVAAVRETLRTQGYGQFGVRRRVREALIGFAGFRPFHEPPQLELLYGLRPAAWGEGLATEASRALIRFGFEECDFSVIRASTDLPNDASIRVMERLGMTVTGVRDAGGRPTLFAELPRERFRWPGGTHEITWRDR